MSKMLIAVFLFVFTVPALQAQETTQFALLKYRGGGDWYSVVDALENVAAFCNSELHTNIDPEYATVEVSNPEIFNYPFLFLTGHGNIVLSDQEAENLRTYLNAGGFLYIDDDYGLDKFIRPAMKKVFPNNEFVELPFDHPIYDQEYEFKDGVPKIHEHDNEPSKGYAIMIDGRVAVFYTVESNLSDGWESPDVHNVSNELREEALKMGANIIQFAFTQ